MSDATATGDPAADDTGSSRDAPEDGSPTCGYCGRSFAREEYRDLHLGVEHGAAMTDAERVAFSEAREAEERALRLFRYKVLGLLVVVYFLFLMAYALSL